MAQLTSKSDHDLQVREMILLALLRASWHSTNCVDYDDLVIEAWRLFPEQFSLGKYPQHPDASNIHKQLYGSLKTNRLIATCGAKTFALTAAGLAEATRLLRKEILVPRPAPAK